MRILLAIPRTALFRAETRHNINQIVKRVFHATKDRKYNGPLVFIR